MPWKSSQAYIHPLSPDDSSRELEEEEEDRHDASSSWLSRQQRRISRLALCRDTRESFFLFLILVCACVIFLLLLSSFFSRWVVCRPTEPDEFLEPREDEAKGEEENAGDQQSGGASGGAEEREAEPFTPFEWSG